MTGLDFSPAAIDAARTAADAAGLDAFVVGDVHDAVALLGGATFDIVYTGFGALTWLPDLDRWARVVAGLLAPAAGCCSPSTTPSPRRSTTTSWLGTLRPGTAIEMDEAGTYVDFDAATRHNRARRWDHGLGRIVSSVAGAGLIVERLRELDETWDPGERSSLVGPGGAATCCRARRRCPSSSS